MPPSKQATDYGLLSKTLSTVTMYRLYRHVSNAYVCIIYIYMYIYRRTIEIYRGSLDHRCKMSSGA